MWNALCARLHVNFLNHILLSNYIECLVWPVAFLFLLEYEVKKQLLIRNCQMRIWFLRL